MSSGSRNLCCPQALFIGGEAGRTKDAAGQRASPAPVVYFNLSFFAGSLRGRTWTETAVLSRTPVPCKPAPAALYRTGTRGFHSGEGRVDVSVLLEGTGSAVVRQKLNFLISAGVQGFEPFHNMSSLSCSTRSKTFHNAGSFRKVTLKSLPCSKHPESSFP